MIFVTVGTHEQPFDRLIKYVDELKKDGVITEDVIMQTGYSKYEPLYCQWSRMFPYREMQKYMDNARIVITHGGPSSFMDVLQRGKVPVVVPRQAKYKEHVNNHQVEFIHAMDERAKNIISVYEIEQLDSIVMNYDRLVLEKQGRMGSNNALFCEKFEQIVDQLLDK